MSDTPIIRKDYKSVTRIAAALAVLSIALLAGCSGDTGKLKSALQEVATNTNGKITVRLEVGTFGKKGVFIFEDVNRDAFK